MVETGMVTQDQGLHLLDFPDLNKYVSSKTAKVDDIMATIDAIVYDNEYQPPEPFQDLQFGIEMFQASYLKFKRKKVPEANLQMLRTWIAEALYLMNPEPNQMDMENQQLASQEAYQAGEQKGSQMQHIGDKLDEAGIDMPDLDLDAIGQ